MLDRIDLGVGVISCIIRVMLYSPIRSFVLTALLALLPGAVEARPTCPTGGDPLWLDSQSGKTVSLTGRYTWDMHYQLLYLEGCSDDDVIFVSLSSPAAGQLDRFLRAAYPGWTLGSGSVWGVFSGKVVRSKTGLAYLRIDSMAIDENRKMPIAEPPK
jgi:hypothetical protein